MIVFAADKPRPVLHIAMAHRIKQEVLFHPLHIRLLKANAVVLYTNTNPQLVKQIGAREEESEEGEVMLSPDVIGHSSLLNQRVEVTCQVIGHVG
jgi:hypothetical protein